MSGLTQQALVTGALSSGVLAVTKVGKKDGKGMWMDLGLQGGASIISTVGNSYILTPSSSQINNNAMLSLLTGGIYVGTRYFVQGRKGIMYPLLKSFVSDLSARAIADQIKY